MRFFALLLRMAVTATAPLVAAFGDATEQNADRPLQHSLVRSGVSKARAEQVTLAWEAAKEAENAEPFRPLLREQDLEFVRLAAFLSAEASQKSTGAMIRELLDDGQGDSATLLFSLSYSYSKENIDWLVTRLGEEQDAREEAATRFALAVLTQRRLSQSAAWREWWQQHREDFHLLPAADGDTQMRRMRRAAERLGVEEWRTAVQTLARQVTLSNEQIGKTLGERVAMLKAGAAFQLSAEAEDGDAFFAESQFPEAAARYAAAVEKDPADSRSRFLRAVVLYELSSLAEASVEIAEVVRREPGSMAARFVEGFFARRSRQPDEPLVEAALTEFATSDLSAAQNFSGWPDPLMGLLLTQMSTSRSVLGIDLERLDELTEQVGDDQELELGVALLRWRGRKLSELRRIAQKYPDWELPLAALLQELISRNKDNYLEIIATVEGLHSIAPENLVPVVLLAHYRSFPGLPRVGDKDWDKKDAFPEAAIEFLRQNQTLTRWDDYAVGLSRLRSMANRALASPLIGDLSSDSLPVAAVLPFFRLFNAAKFQGETDLDKALEIISLAERLTQMAGGPTSSVLQRELILSSQAAVTKRRRELLAKKSGVRVDPAAGNRQEPSEEELQRVESQSRLGALLFLPIPTLQNALSELMIKDAPALVERVSAAGEASRSEPVRAEGDSGGAGK